MSKVLVMESTYETCREAVDRVFSNFPIDLKGKRVAIKTNALKGSDPDREAMVTHYKLIKAGVGSGRTSREFFRTRIAYRPVFSAEKCDQECNACVEACPAGALTRELIAPVLDPSKCMLCSACRESCDHEAVQLKPDEKIMSLLND